MITICQNTAWGLRGASRILLLCIIHASYAVAAETRPAKIAIAQPSNTRFAHLTTKAGLRGDRNGKADSPPHEVQSFDTQGGRARVRDLKFTHLTTNDGLSQNTIKAILQDSRGFMWFATRDGLNRYDGNAFLVYKNNPNDPGSLSANFVTDLIEDDQGNLWIATFNGGVNKFNPTTERFTRYTHDPSNVNSISDDHVENIIRDSRGYLWFGTQNFGLDKFDPATGGFTHYRNDSDGQFVGKFTHVIEDRHGDIWFVGERGLFHLNVETGQITHPRAAINSSLVADNVSQDDAGNLWLLAHSPIVGLVKYDRKAEQFTEYPVGAGAVGISQSKLFDDGGKGFWVPSSLGLYYFDRRTERFTYRFQHDETNPHSLSDNAVVAVYQDRSGVLWVGTEQGGLNLLTLEQKQFGFYRHRPAEPNSLSPGRVTAIYEDLNDVLWIGFFPRAVDRFDRKTGQITHYVPGPGNALSKGSDVKSIYKDPRGYLWFGGWNSGLNRFDERTGKFKHYMHNPDDPNTLTSDNVITIYGDRSGRLWVGHFDGISRFDPATEQFTNYQPDPNNPASFWNSVSTIYQDRSGTMWLGTWGGALIRFGEKTSTVVNYQLDPHSSRGLNFDFIYAIHEDRTGTLWVGSAGGLFRYDRQKGAVARYAESQGLPNSVIEGILEDRSGRLWLSTKKGISRFDPRTETFRNYDTFDGLQTDDFSESCYRQGRNEEMLFGGANGITAFFPENIRDNPYVPPVVITSFKIFNKPVPIGCKVGAQESHLLR